MTYRSLNPATEQLLAEFPEASEQAVEAALAASTVAAARWRRTSFQQRSDVFKAVARTLRAQQARLAGLITLEMGKPIVEAEAEIEKCAFACDYYAENAEALLADQVRVSNATESYVALDPIGTVLAIMPWNYPFWQVLRFAAPALMAGNAALLKHAPNVPQCANAIVEVFAEAGLPDSVFQSLFLANERVAGLIEDDRIAAVTLTGSGRAGASVASYSGAALKPTVLELGGSDPFIVLPDADLDLAVSGAINGRYQNAGQSCIAAKRLILTESVADAFLERFVPAVQQLRLDHPTERATQIGPIARDDLRANLESQLNRSLDLGATLLTGGHRPDRPGFYFEPSVLVDVKPGMPAFDEETFGPVAAVSRARDADQAIDLANQTSYGLGASIWTRDTELAKRMARDIESGMVFVNGIVASDPRIPFGGIKRSGYGRELSDFGIREFVNVKTVWIGPKRS